MTVSTLTLVNKALVICGARVLSDYDEDTQNGRIVRVVYDISRQSILTECKWSFSVSRATLTTTVATTEIGWFRVDENYAYARPTAALRIFGVDDDNAVWRTIGSYVLADTASLGVEYAFDQEDVSKYLPKFVEAFIDKLCADISFMILNDGKKAVAFLEKYENVSLPKAMAENSQTGAQQYAKDDAWENAKYQNESPAA